MATFGKRFSSTLSRKSRNNSKMLNCTQDQCEKCTQALRQIISCNNCFSSLGKNLVKILMTQLKNLDSSNPCNSLTLESSYNHGHVSQYDLDQTRDMGQNKTTHNLPSNGFSAYKLNIPMAQKYETPKALPKPLGHSVVVDADGSFISNDDLSEKKSNLSRVKSLRPGPHIIQKMKKNSSCVKSRSKFKVISNVLKRNRRSSMSKKQIIKKSIGLLKQGLLKKLTADLNSIGGHKKSLLILEPKPKRKSAQVKNSKIKAKSPNQLQLPQNDEQNSMNGSFRLSDGLRSITSKDSSWLSRKS
ncbi:unnamed protein product [Moneuplotes crassus]|uniref:Uncharacterized protein n=1 Tax=Euplotes crassus TaxID=5936 RepID=A0AAD1UF60_EUPCR|nr:unnamed protein product [Moneuplotes crassus]